jgi:hypothetical protein
LRLIFSFFAFVRQASSAVLAGANGGRGNTKA